MFRDFTIINPGEKIHADYVNRAKKKDPKANVMDYFLGLAKNADVVTVLPFLDGRWGAGVMGEVEVATNAGALVAVFNPNNVAQITFLGRIPKELALSVEETRSRVYFADRTIKPYM
jgi:hypothetical protein